MGKHLVLSNLQTLLPPIKHLIDKKAENVDWNENDPNAKGYVRNRPFYEKVEETFVQNLSTVTLTASIEEDFDNLVVSSVKLDYPLIEGQTYTVVFDDVAYQCLAKNYDGYIMIGNNAIYEYDSGAENDTGEPFAAEMWTGALNEIVFYLSEEKEFTVSISGVEKVTTIKKIDEKFLPPQKEIELGHGDMIGQTSIGYHAEVFNDYLNNYAVGEYSHVEGEKNTAHGNYSHVEGINNIAYGSGSHVTGKNNFSDGTFSTIIGLYNKIHRDTSTAFRYEEEGKTGESTSNLNYQGDTAVYVSKYKPDFFSSLGYIFDPNTTTKRNLSEGDCFIEVHEAIYNKTNDVWHAPLYKVVTQNTGGLLYSDYYTTIDLWNQKDNLFVVGNGTSDTSRSNAHTLDWSGNAWYQGDVYVGGSGQDDAAAEKLVKQSELTEATSDLASKSHVEAVAAALGNIKANKAAGVHYIEGYGEAAGTWRGYHADIDEYYDGLMIAYKIGVAGLSSGTTLDINELGAVTVVRNVTTNISTAYAVNSVIFLVYTTDSSGTSYWKVADYDANTRNTVGDYNLVGTKLYITGTKTYDSSSTSSYAVSYANSNCYIGTDNCLYSGGEKVVVASEISAITSDRINAICGSTTT